MSRELRISYTTGNTVTAKVYDSVATTLTGTVSLTEAPAGSGAYAGTMPAAAAGVYDVIYLDGTTIIASESITWNGTAIVVAGVTVTCTTPVDPVTQTINLVTGDDYKAADSRALTFTLSGVPSAVGGAVHLIVYSGSTIALNATGSVIDATTVQVELTAAQTTTLSGEYQYALRITLADTFIVTPALGYLSAHLHA